MTTSPIVLALRLCPLLPLWTAWGCGSCMQENNPAPALAPEAAAPISQASNVQSTPVQNATPKSVPRDGPRHGLMLAVELPDDRVHLWVEGQSKSLERPAGATQFSASGFEWSEGEVTRVMGAGGGAYYRMGEPNLEAQEMRTLFESSDPAPEGYEVSWNVARGGLYQTELRIGGQAKLKLGRLAKNEPIGDAWTVGMLPPGVAAPALVGELSWPREEGLPLAMLPDGLTEIHSAATPAQEAIWLTDIAEIRAGEVTLRQSLVVDLDRDEEAEGAICVSGGTGDYTCFLVDDVGTERRYFGLHLGLMEESPLMAFSNDEGHYLAWVGRLNRSRSETDSPKLHLVRFDGGGFLTDIIQ